jgi:hypothetical protein
VRLKRVSLSAALHLAYMLCAFAYAPSAMCASADHGGFRFPPVTPPAFHHLLYVALPGSEHWSAWLNGIGVVVLDVDDGWRFVKRIPTWQYAASMSPEQISGIAASPISNLLYVSARGRLGAIDLATDRMVWSVTLDGHCCERPQVTPDGKIVVVGGDLRDYWYEVDAKTGRLIGILDTPASEGSHNLNLSPDGKRAFMSPWNTVMTISDIRTRKVIRTIRFPDRIRVFVLNEDASRVYANVDNFLGYVVADVKTGRIIQKVEVKSVNWRAKWFVAPRPNVAHDAPSHGIAITPNGKEIWLDDALFNEIHIFSNTGRPREIDTIHTTAAPCWITFGLDAKYAYVSSGDIIDITTHKIVGQMRDEYGRAMYSSEKVLDMSFLYGHLQRVSNQFANAFGDYSTAWKDGVGPRVVPMPGRAALTLGPVQPGP